MGKLYDPVDKRLQRKPKPDHPWAKWRPGWLRINPRSELRKRKYK